MGTIVTQITDCIELILQKTGTTDKIIVFPCGDIGIQIINILKNVYDIEPAYIIDNKKCRYTNKIYDISILERINLDDYMLILACVNNNIYKKLKDSAEKYIARENIVELECMKYSDRKVGKYSYGPLCNHAGVKSIGAFCSFAEGTDVVGNHSMSLLSTHPFLYDSRTSLAWYFPGVNPHSVALKGKECRIGNDVWLGKNVIITNGANIGNGVIAAAGAVITKDVPDYAVVAGVPARIIRFRYNTEQIAALNRIAWWDWSDEEIRERYEDFYLSIEEFIKKYDSL